MAEAAPEKVVVPVGDLETECIYACTVKGCPKIYYNQSNLRMHVLKHHENKKLEKKIKTSKKQVYCCPIISCKYSLKGGRYFDTMKSIKQHYLKVHGEKKYVCSCGNKYSTETTLNYHKRHECGKSFVCSCGYSYTTLSGLTTHTRRLNHTPRILVEDKTKQEKINMINNTVTCTPVTESDLAIAQALTELGNIPKSDASVQADINIKHKIDNHAQTGIMWDKAKISSQTQTQVTMGGVANAATKAQKCIETQTPDDPAEFKNANLPEIEKISNYLCNLKGDVWLDQKSTQTVRDEPTVDESLHTSSQTQTDFLANDQNTDFVYSDTQTQTCDDLDDLLDIINHDLFPNGCDIQTQTFDQ